MSEKINIEQRKQDREQAFILIFEKSFSDDSVQEIITQAVASRELIPADFAIKAASGVYDNLNRIDTVIEQNSIGWQINRLSRVVRSILRLAIYEMLFLSTDIPYSVSINEAVELAKKYAGKEDPAFINGVLGGFTRKLGEKA